MNTIRRRVSEILLGEYTNDVEGSNFNIVIVKWTKKLQDDYYSGYMWRYDEIGDPNPSGFFDAIMLLGRYFKALITVDLYWNYSELDNVIAQY